jgi:hypothetical protein
MKLFEKYLKSKVKKVNEAVKKGDMVSFYNDSGDLVRGEVVSVNGGIYTISYEGDTYQTNDIIVEGYGAGMSLTDHGYSDSSASLKASISSINKKVAAIVDMVKGGDISGAAKSAVAGVFRHGSEFKEKIDSAIDSAEFKAEYKKVHADYQSGKKDEPETKDKTDGSKGSD